MVKNGIRTDVRGTVGSETKKLLWRLHFEGGKKGYDVVKGELWYYVYFISNAKC